MASMDLADAYLKRASRPKRGQVRPELPRFFATEDCRRGKQMLRALSRWEYYLENDPVLGEPHRHETHAAS